MRHIKDMEYIKLYNTTNSLILPLSDKDKFKHSAIILVTPNIETSIEVMKSTAFINKNYFKSYYLEKSINTILNENNNIIGLLDFDGEKSTEVINESCLLEDGYKYDTNIINWYDARQARQAYEHHYKDVSIVNGTIDNRYMLPPSYKILYYSTYRIGNTAVAYSYATKSNDSETLNYVILINKDVTVAEGNDPLNHDNILHTIRTQFLTDMIRLSMANKHKFNFAKVSVSSRDGKEMIEDSKLYTVNIRNIKLKSRYTLLNTIEESVGPIDVENIEGSNLYGDNYVGDDNLKIIPNFLIEQILSTSGNNIKLKKLLYNERIKNYNEIIHHYNSIKEKCPVIKITRLDLDKYGGLNVFYDTSFYNRLFMKNNNFTGDRALSVYGSLLQKLINSRELVSLYDTKTIFIPLNGWYEQTVRDSLIIDFQKNTNPYALIVRALRTKNLKLLQDIFGDNDILLFNRKCYMKINFSNFDITQTTKFINLLNNMIVKDEYTLDDNNNDSPRAMALDIVDKLEKKGNLKLYSALTGSRFFTGSRVGSQRYLADEDKVGDDSLLQYDNPTDDVVPDLGSDMVDDSLDSNFTGSKGRFFTGAASGKIDKSEPIIGAESEEDAVNIDLDEKKEDLIHNIASAVTTSNDVDGALDKLDSSEWTTALIQSIADIEDTSIKIPEARLKRMNTLNANLVTKKVNDVTIKDLLAGYSSAVEPLSKTPVKINTINSDEWENISFPSFNSEYNIHEDIVEVLRFFSTRSVPIGIRDVNVENVSTSEDYIETWKVGCEDINGTRFQLKFDLPLFINDSLMRLRGNDKIMGVQLMNIPIAKTDVDVCQITTNYNKIFFRTYGDNFGKSNVVLDRIIKVLNTYDGKDITIELGSSSLSMYKYKLPVDYANIGTQVNRIKCKGATFYFDQDRIRKVHKDKIDFRKGLPVGYDHVNHGIIYYNEVGTFSKLLLSYLTRSETFSNLYEKTKPASRYTYSKASILNTRIPVIVLCAYCEGLFKTLDKAKIMYSVTDKRNTSMSKDVWDHIRFNDGFLYYEINYESSMLMNGLKEFNTQSYSIKETDSKMMWLNALDIYGGRLKADGIDNFYDLMMDPLTTRACEIYKLPTDFVSALIYSSNLLCNTDYCQHTDITSNRLRFKEIVAGYTFKELAKSYSEYRNRLKRTSKVTMSIKQSAVIDALLLDNTTADSSTINDANYAESTRTVGWKGLSGLNNERSYSLDKRSFHDSMINKTSLATGFGPTVGVNRQLTVDADINSKRGIVKQTATEDEMCDTKTMSIGEALIPGCTTHDDPMRLAMSFTQRIKHSMRTRYSTPILITNGMDQALPHFTPDYFSVVAKQDGTVIEKTDKHLIVKYKDGTTKYIDLERKVFKNSDGGFYTVIQLTTPKLGKTFKAGHILAYDEQSYDGNNGYDDNIIYKQGVMCRVALINTEEGFEDSTIVDSYICDVMSSDIITMVPIDLDKGTNVYNLVTEGQSIQEGEHLMDIQNAYDDENINKLLKKLVDDEETVNSLGRIPIKSKNTGYIESVKVYRTVEIEELSESLQKIVKAYESKENKKINEISKYDKELARTLTNTYKLKSTGKLKNLEAGVRIEIYVRYVDDFSIGDKLVIVGAQKGVAKDVFKKGEEPRTLRNPDEPINALISMRSLDARMCTMPILYTSENKLLIELSRQIRDRLGIKQSNTIMSKEYLKKNK